MIFSNYFSHLIDLIRFGLGAITLQINFFINPRFSEYVMTPLGSFIKSKPPKEVAQIFKFNIRI